MKNKSLFSRLLENKKLLLIASFVLAFVFWIISSDNITKTIDDIPLRTVLSESAEKEGLKVYSVNPETVSVEVSGKRLIVDALSKEDFSAYADLFNVSKSGTETYSVKIETKSNTSFSIDDVKPLRATVMVDKEITKTVTVHKLFEYEPSEGYHISDDMPSTVTITGPQTLVDEVKSAYVTDVIKANDDLTAKKTFTVHLCDKSDPKNPDKKDIHSEFLKLSNESFADVNFKFQRIQNDVPLALAYDQESFTLPPECYSFEPKTIDLAGDEKLFSGENGIQQIVYNLGSFSKFKNEVVELEIDTKDLLSEGLVCTSVDKVKLTLNLSFLSEKTFTTDNIQFVGLSDYHNYDLPDKVNVQFIGVPAVLSDLDENSFNVIYDFTHIVSIEDAAYVEVPVSVKIKNNKNVGVFWVYKTSDTEKINIIK